MGYGLVKVKTMAKHTHTNFTHATGHNVIRMNVHVHKLTYF